MVLLHCEGQRRVPARACAAERARKLAEVPRRRHGTWRGGTDLSSQAQHTAKKGDRSRALWAELGSFQKRSNAKGSTPSLLGKQPTENQNCLSFYHLAPTAPTL